MAEQDTPKPAPVFDPAKVPLPVADKHPLRCAIRGEMHLVEELRKSVLANETLDPDLRTYISTELDELETNAAQIDLHVIDHPDPRGGVILNLTITPRQLGPALTAPAS